MQSAGVIADVEFAVPHEGDRLAQREFRVRRVEADPQTGDRGIDLFDVFPAAEEYRKYPRRNDPAAQFLIFFHRPPQLFAADAEGDRELVAGDELVPLLPRPRDLVGGEVQIDAPVVHGDPVRRQPGGDHIQVVRHGGRELPLAPRRKDEERLVAHAPRDPAQTAPPPPQPHTHGIVRRRRPVDVDGEVEAFAPHPPSAGDETRNYRDLVAGGGKTDDPVDRSRRTRQFTDALHAAISGIGEEHDLGVRPFPPHRLEHREDDHRVADRAGVKQHDLPRRQGFRFRPPQHRQHGRQRRQHPHGAGDQRRPRHAVGAPSGIEREIQHHADQRRSSGDQRRPSFAPHRVQHVRVEARGVPQQRPFDQDQRTRRRVSETRPEKQRQDQLAEEDEDRRRRDHHQRGDEEHAPYRPAQSPILALLIQLVRKRREYSGNGVQRPDHQRDRQRDVELKRLLRRADERQQHVAQLRKIVIPGARQQQPPARFHQIAPHLRRQRMPETVTAPFHTPDHPGDGGTERSERIHRDHRRQAVTSPEQQHPGEDRQGVPQQEQIGGDERLHAVQQHRHRHRNADRQRQQQQQPEYPRRSDAVTLQIAPDQQSRRQTDDRQQHADDEDHAEAPGVHAARLVLLAPVAEVGDEEKCRVGDPRRSERDHHPDQRKGGVKKRVFVAGQRVRGDTPHQIGADADGQRAEQRKRRVAEKLAPDSAHRALFR